MAGKFELYQGKAGEFRFRLKAANGEIILVSEGYQRRASAENGIASVRKNAASDERYERKKSSSDKPMFNLRAPNGQLIGTSETYSSNSARDKGVESVKKNAPEAELVDQTNDYEVTSPILESPSESKVFLLSVLACFDKSFAELESKIPNDPSRQAAWKYELGRLREIRNDLVSLFEVLPDEKRDLTTRDEEAVETVIGTYGSHVSIWLREHADEVTDASARMLLIGALSGVGVLCGMPPAMSSGMAITLLNGKKSKEFVQAILKSKGD